MQKRLLFLFFVCLSANVWAQRVDAADFIHQSLSDYKTPFVLTFFAIYEQQLLLPNEECVFSFKTKNGKTMMLAKDKSDKYLIYRFGTQNKVELEFPSETKDSWQQFTFKSYMRGGGKQNAGRETFELLFTNKNVEYNIYREYLAEDESIKVGISITDLKTGKTSHIKGLPTTTIGELYWFQHNNLVKKDN